MIQLQKNVNVSSLLSALIVGILVFLVFSYLLVPAKITLPISVIMSILSFGLTQYYSVANKEATYSFKHSNNNNSTSDFKNSPTSRNQNTNKQSISNLFFALIYSVTILISVLFSKPNLDAIYITWNFIEIKDIINLGAGVLLAFFLPGCAVILSLCKKYMINPLLKILLGYLFSTLITALTTYISAIYFHNNIFEIKNLLIGVYLVILLAFIIYHRLHRIYSITNKLECSIFYEAISHIFNKFWEVLKLNFPMSMVFASIFGLLIISTYYLYGGITIGDQWLHQGRALLFLSGQFRDSLLPTEGELIYTPLNGALLAGLSSLSGTPLVNTYASIAFLNMTAIFAFYYFCREWLTLKMKRAALFASTLFVLGGGFGWIYLLYSTGAYPVTSQISSISVFLQEQVKFSDIIMSANFMIAAFPDFSTGLIYIALPAGFVLLGIVRLKLKSKFIYTAVVSMVALLGIIFHDEFHIFIIISSILPLAFNLKNRSCVFLSFLIAFGFVYVLDAISPIKYFTSREILGIPLITLNVFFIMITWALYAFQQNFHIQSNFISSLLKGRKYMHPSRNIYRTVTKITVIWAVAYLTVLSFIVWTQLPPNDIQAHTTSYNNPWYLYPIRLGLIGLFGLTYILSYLFKKLEKEVFVFGIIIIVALMTGPYYNEHRFSKYIMAGMIGFASLLIFQLLYYLAKRHPMANGITISLIVLFASLSTLMFIGYNALIIETQDYADALGRRNFPSVKEMNLLEFMRSKIHTDSNINNVASFSNEYKSLEGGIITKLRSFSGLPYAKIIQSPLTLNASTLDKFYHLLEYSNTKYIVIPNTSIKDKLIPPPSRFALDNFQRVYEDNEYLVLKVPSLSGPSTNSRHDVGIISSEFKPISPIVADSKYLLFSNDTFDLTNVGINLKNLKKNDTTENATFISNKKGGVTTVWSRNLTDNGINYIETRFRIIEEDKSGKNAVELKWIDDKREYAISYSNSGLELKQLSQNGKTILISKNTEIEKKKGTWYRLTIESLEDSINAYVDNTLKLTIKKIIPEKSQDGILKVGIKSTNNVVELEPIQIGKVPYSESFYTEKNEYDYYYPLSSLALSGSNYDVFSYDDYSVFSKKKVIIPSHFTFSDDTIFNKYIEYAKSGGTLVLMNSDENFNGNFSKLFSIEHNPNEGNGFAKFNRIVADHDERDSLEVSGMVKNIVMNSSADVNILSWYVNENKEAVAPFVIEKILPSKGKIIFVNSKGYFDAIKNNPKEYFPSLSNFSKLFNNASQEKTIDQSSARPTNRFLGEVKISGSTSLNGSSLLISDMPSDSNTISVENLSITDKNGNLKNSFKKATISMKLYGHYHVLINTNDNLMLPSPISHSGYVGALLPKGFNMTVRLMEDKNSHAELMIKHGSYNKTLVVNNESKIQFYNIKLSAASSRSIPVIMKNPDITVIGNMDFKSANFGRDPYSYIPLNIDGEIKAKFDFVDKYDVSHDNGTRTRYATYLKSIVIDGITHKDIDIKLPGDIPSNKKSEFQTQLKYLLISPANIMILIFLTAITIVVSKLVWSKL